MDTYFKSLLNRSPILRILVAGRLLGPLGIIMASLLFSLSIAVLLVSGFGTKQNLGWLFLLVVSVALVTSLVGAVRLRNQLLKPLVELEQSVADVCEGEPWSTLPMETVGVLGPVTRDLDSLSGELIDLYEDMDNRVARQTRRLAQQTASIKILYDVAASINQMGYMDGLLLKFLPVIKEMVNGRAGTVQLISPEGKMRLVGSMGPDEILLSEQEQLPVRLCQCGRTLSSGEILCEHDAEACSRRIGRRMYTPEELGTVEVPLKFHGDLLGLYRVYVRQPGLAGREDLVDLLSTIGTHLSIAIAKQRSDDEAHRLSIIEERTTLANELHDSLAQTLASLRFQVRMLDETLEQSDAHKGARGELERIRNGLDEAHTELRELLNSFRAPMDERGLESAVQKLIERFRQEAGVSIFFQKRCRHVNLGASEEMQILRIIQECLANIRKHAKAHTVRVLLTCSNEGQYVLLVEDDGVGFDDARPDGKPGEHIGLSIMDERASRLGAKLRIESEPGEGTRVELIYDSRAVEVQAGNREAS